LPLVEAGYVDAEQLTAEEAEACVDHTGKRGREPLPLRIGIVPRRSGRAPVD
jgi:hypothetical protein